MSDMTPHERAAWEAATDTLERELGRPKMGGCSYGITLEWIPLLNLLHLAALEALTKAARPEEKP